ncbi:MAG: AI-2E family transporter [bacterium]|nr:AI-2E family transporter [Gammaproteobacteria bacterium]HIL98257.1 AI-2E family transporter [Pseudomonadales bacterium]
MGSLRPVERGLALASIAFLFFMIYLLQPILTPFLVGMAIAYLGDPLVDRLQSKLGRTGGVLVVFVLLLIIVVIGLVLLLPMLIAEVGSLVKSVPEFIQWLQQTTSPFLIEHFGIDPFDLNMTRLKSQLTENWTKVGGVAQKLILQLTSSGYSIALSLANIALIPVVSFYLMRDWDVLVGYLREMLARDVEETVVGLVKECDEVLSAFLRGQMLVMFVLGCIYSTGLMMLGLDLALLIGMLAGLASIVPYLGFFVGITAATFAAIVQFQDSFVLIYVVIIFGVGQALEGMVLTPLLVGDRIGLHPVAVIFAILAGGQLFGFTGILLALPVAAVVMVFMRFMHDRYKKSEFYSGVEEVSLSADSPENGSANKTNE